MFPADVESANYAAIQIAVLYDSDGSVTDMLLGGGASSPAASSSGGHTRVSGGGGGDAAAAAAAEVETLVGSYATTVNGTQYAGSVEEENGAYTASVPNVSGATATGATLMEAENNLTIRIDELV